MESSQSRSTAPATVLEHQPRTKVASGTSQAASCNTKAAGGIGDQLNDGVAATTSKKGSRVMPASPARRGGVKAEDITIDQTDMAWSGSVHCM